MLSWTPLHPYANTFATWLLPPSTLQLDLLSSLQHLGVQTRLCSTLDTAAFQRCLHHARAGGADTGSGAGAGLGPVHSHPRDSSWVCTCSAVPQGLGWRRKRGWSTGPCSAVTAEGLDALPWMNRGGCTAGRGSGPPSL